MPITREPEVVGLSGDDVTVASDIVMVRPWAQASSIRIVTASSQQKKVLRTCRRWYVITALRDLSDMVRLLATK